MENLQEIIDQHIENGLYHGVEWKINHSGNIIQGKSGYLDITKNTPIVPDTIYRIWSMTKPIISIVILQMIEEGIIKFDDELPKFLPQFSNIKVLKNIKANIKDVEDIKNQPTIKDLLMHTAGFSYNFLDDPIGEQYHKIGLFNSKNNSLEEEINLLATIPLLYQPSSNWVYSVSVDILARIIEIVSGTTLQNQLKNRIFDPLKMNNTGFSINESNRSKLMSSYHYDSINNILIAPNTHSRKIANYDYPLNSKSFARGGIGLFSTLTDYSKFAKMLLTGKTDKGEIILSKELLNKATTNHLSGSLLPFEIKNFDIQELEENVFDAYGWGLGFRVMIDLKKTKGIGSLGEFGWGGAASTYFLVDPKNDLSAVLMTQVFEGNPILHKDFISTIYFNI